MRRPRPWRLRVGIQAQLTQDVVEVDRLEVDPCAGQGRGRLHLEESTDPRIGHADSLLEDFFGVFRIDTHGTRRVVAADLEVGLAVGPQVLQAVVEVLAEVDVGRTADLLDAGVELEGLPVEREAGVARLVFAEDLEGELVRAHGDDRVEDQEGERVIALEPGEVLELGLPLARPGRLPALALVGEIGGAILGHIAEVAFHHGVERREGFAHEQGLA